MSLSIDTTKSGFSEVQEYKINEGKLTVFDKTKGVATVVFSGDTIGNTPNYPTYKVFVNKAKLVWWMCSNPKDDVGLTFRKSLSFTLSFENGWVKIEEQDPLSKGVFYVDPNNSIQGIAYGAYDYLPKEISKEEAMKKIENLGWDYPSFDPYVMLYNRHGVALFGWDERDERYTLCWANPSEDKVKKMETSQCSRYRDGGTSIAQSKEGSVDFRYLYGQESYLNGELAKINVIKGPRAE